MLMSLDMAILGHDAMSASSLLYAHKRTCGHAKGQTNSA
jgi:hypothetical protein